MDPSSLFYLFLFILLLGFSAFFSASETAYFSLPKSTREKFSKSKSVTARQVAHLLGEPRRLLIAIIIGNTLVNVAIASLATLITSRMIQTYTLNRTLTLILNVVVVTFVILFFSEIVPKVTAIKNANRLSRFFSLPLTFFYYLFYPVAIVLDLLTQLIESNTTTKRSKYHLTEAELRTLVDVGEEKGALLQEEKEMIHSIFEMGDTVAREIMVPRTDMVCLDKSSSLNHVLNVIKEKMHSRIPVYDETVDNILGILYVKDLLPFIRKRNTSDFNLARLVRPPYYVPEQKKINELLREFQAEKIHMAIVVDEYGGTSGLVTLEDVIEEIVGEIQDEFDEETPLIEKVNEHTFLVKGGILIDEINEQLGLDLPTEEGVDTLAGFLLGQFGSVPKVREKIEYNGYQFVIEKASKKRILQVRLLLKPKEKGRSNAGDSLK